MNGRTVPSLIGGGLEQPAGCGADGDDAAAAGPRRCDLSGGDGADLAVLGRHDVIFDARRLHRYEAAGTDVQGQPGAPDAGGGEAGEQLVGEVQAGGRRGDRPRPAGEHRLIVGKVTVIAAAAADVGRQRRRAEPLQLRKKGVARERKDEIDAAVGTLAGDRCRHTGRKANRLADPQPPSGADEGPPAAAAPILDQRRLDGDRITAAEQTDRQNAGIVEDEPVPGTQQPRQVAHEMVGEAACGDEQPGGIARRHRPLRDRRCRQREIEIVDVHAEAVIPLDLRKRCERHGSAERRYPYLTTAENETGTRERSPIP